MSDRAREQIRAAQAAELRGDFSAAIRALRQAAALLRARGSLGRALQLLRHAQRLGAGRHSDFLAEFASLADEAARVLGPERDSDGAEDAQLPPSQTFDLELDGGAERSSAAEHGGSVDRLAGEGVRGENPGRGQGGMAPGVVRGLTWVDTEPGAWCSFCCRPGREVGSLVLGPAAAYLCAGCASHALRLFNAGSDVVSVAQESAQVEPGPTHTASALVPEPLVGKSEALAVLELALKVDARVVLILGPEGSGKSAVLRWYAAKGFGAYVEGSEPPTHAPGNRVFWDNVERRSPPELRRFVAWLEADRERRLFVALRGKLPVGGLHVRSDEVELEVPSTQALLEATWGHLPVDLAEAVQMVAELRAPSERELRVIAHHLVERRRPSVEVGPKMLAALVREAGKSPRGARELEALIERLPAGHWTLREDGSVRSSRRKAKQVKKQGSQSTGKAKADRRPRSPRKKR